MTLKELILKNRSCRRFKENEPINKETLLELVDLARLSASGGNLQPLKYIISYSSHTNELIFPHLMWARLLKPWKGPSVGERPAAYIIILLDKKISENAGCDHGIAAQTITLGAAEKGIAGCMIGSIARPALRKSLNIAEQYEILLVIALGKPAEKIILEECKTDNDTAYWRDEDGVHHVPKRKLDSIIIPI